MATQEQINKVRLYCYNATEGLLPDAIIAANIDKWLAIYPSPEQEGIALYNATIDCLYYLIYTDPNAPSGSSGYSRTEKVGQVSVSVQYSGEYISPWQKILDGYLNGDLVVPGAVKNVTGKVIIGGVDAGEINRVNLQRNSVNGLGCMQGVDKKQATKRTLDYLNPYFNPYRRR